MLHFIDQFRKIYYPTQVRFCVRLQAGADSFASQDPKADQETTEYKVARMELVEEIAEKFVPETVFTNVSMSPSEGSSGHTFTPTAVYDPNSERCFLAVAYAKAFRPPNGSQHVLVARGMLEQPNSRPFPSQPEDGSDVYERGLTL